MERNEKCKENESWWGGGGGEEEEEDQEMRGEEWEGNLGDGEGGLEEVYCIKYE